MVAGSGFDAASRSAIAWLVVTEYVAADQITAEVPAISGPAGAATVVDAFAVNGGVKNPTRAYVRSSLPGGDATGIHDGGGGGGGDPGLRARRADQRRHDPTVDLYGRAGDQGDDACGAR